MTCGHATYFGQSYIHPYSRDIPVYDLLRHQVLLVMRIRAQPAPIQASKFDSFDGQTSYLFWGSSMHQLCLDYSAPCRLRRPGGFLSLVRIFYGVYFILFLFFFNLHLQETKVLSSSWFFFFLIRFPVVSSGQKCHVAFRKKDTCIPPVQLNLTCPRASGQEKKRIVYLMVTKQRCQQYDMAVSMSQSSRELLPGFPGGESF